MRIWMFAGLVVIGEMNILDGLSVLIEFTTLRVFASTARTFLGPELRVGSSL